MSSLVRRIQRRWQRRQGTYEGPQQLTEALPCGGYRTLRPTKGWIKVSGKRLKCR